ncbi:MAG TPA: cytochrome ubiquinol oxidase subunit I [Candidatus Acidoferrales bacterium]|nr:cytochrome ubiquinol oxidase subunit I [Candidatus Acidoferrales bacterium]
MDHLFAARTQFAISMVFHIIFAVYGIGLPLLMVLAERRWLRTHDEAYLVLARRWARAGSLLFAIGAVSGTAISFELGLLWPRFMQFAGAVIGMPFSMEGFAFFIEAIFFALYLYGWDRLSAVAHYRCGIAVAVSAVLSGIFVMDANAWMNSPTGLVIQNGVVVGAHPLAAMLNPFATSEAIHMVLAAYLTVGFGVAAVYAQALLREPQNATCRRGFALPFVLAAIVAPLQIVSGHHSALAVGHLQPPKLAAMEGLFHTTACAPETIGGIPDTAGQTMRFGLPLPCLLSVLMHANPKAVIQGLDAFPPFERPNTVVVHIAFQIMVGCGFAFLGIGLWALALRLRRQDLFTNRWFLRAATACGYLSILALEAGWFVTEVGRQPWTAYHLITTAQSVTPATSTIVPSLVAFSAIYVFLGCLLIWLLLGLGKEHDVAA